MNLSTYLDNNHANFEGVRLSYDSTKQEVQVHPKTWYNWAVSPLTSRTLFDFEISSFIEDSSVSSFTYNGAGETIVAQAIDKWIVSSNQNNLSERLKKAAKFAKAIANTHLSGEKKDGFNFYFKNQVGQVLDHQRVSRQEIQRIIDLNVSYFIQLLRSNEIPTKLDLFFNPRGELQSFNIEGIWEIADDPNLVGYGPHHFKIFKNIGKLQAGQALFEIQASNLCKYGRNYVKSILVATLALVTEKTL